MRSSLHAVAALMVVGIVSLRAQPILFVTIPPQKWLVEQLVDRDAKVEVMVRPGQNPHTFEPLGRQLALMAQAEGWFTIGMPFEQALLRKVRSAKPDLREFQTYRGVERLEADHHHDHGDEEGAVEGDPHIWLSPVNMAQMATNVCADLRALWPEQSEVLQRRLGELSSRLVVLQSELSARTAAVEGRVFWVYHPSWAYYARSFGLRQRAVEESGREPSLRQMASLIKDAKEDKARVLFADPQFDPRPIERLARQIGAEVVVIDPLAGDWERNLRHVTDRIIEGVKDE